MSGSPIYLKDDQGRVRMCGAFAYGWPLTKDPVGGVQPIEYMLALPEGRADGSEGGVTKAKGDSGAVPAQRRMHWSIDEVMKEVKGEERGRDARATSGDMALRP